MTTTKKNVNEAVGQFLRKWSLFLLKQFFCNFSNSMEESSKKMKLEPSLSNLSGWKSDQLKPEDQFPSIQKTLKSGAQTERNMTSNQVFTR